MRKQSTTISIINLMFIMFLIIGCTNNNNPDLVMVNEYFALIGIPESESDILEHMELLSYINTGTNTIRTNNSAFCLQPPVKATETSMCLWKGLLWVPAELVFKMKEILAD